MHKPTWKTGKQQIPPPPIADDHTALKGQRQSDTTRPIIDITRSDTFPQRLNNSIYDVDFVIQSNENIPDIDNPASYKIARCLVDENCATQDATTYTPSNITTTSLQFASISAAITLNDLDDRQATWGFVLLRASARALQDAAGNDPINTDRQPIAPDGILGVVGKGAIARRDRTPPQITLSFRQISYRGKLRLEDGTKTNNDVYNLIFWLIPSVTIPTISGNSYQVIHVSDSDPEVRTVHTQLSRFSIMTPGFLGQQNPTHFTIDVIASDSEVGSTKGFMLARAAAADDDEDYLLDIWGNPPVRAEDGALIGTGTDGLLSTRLISLSWARNIQARIRAKVLLEGPLR